MSEVVAPLNRAGDMKPARWEDGRVITSPGFKEAFRAFVEAGWQGVQQPTEYGGQGLPKLVAAPCMEMMQAANLSFALCPLLTDGAIEALLTAGSAEQKQAYIGRLIDGSWTGTMNLTEPQAGSDLAQVRTRAVPQGDGSYRLFGQKIFITFGEHDLADNIVHLVLARTPDAPPGVKGISLFIVPKFLFEPDGRLTKRNDVYCASIEHKLGIHASPTCVLLFGDGKGEVGNGAIGYLIGEENRGLEYMFIMMNAARFQVGMQGIAVADRAYQQAAAYAKERVQSRAIEGSPGPVPIVQHPDVRRMLMFMRAHTEAARASLMSRRE
jgi:3-(methylthio)propanoyl-CoA dehydrogenase